jgi:hypothetical protein
VQPLIEPNCDMPWEIYLDWLQDQGISDLAEIDVHSLVCGETTDGFYYLNDEMNSIGFGEGMSRRNGDGNLTVFWDLDFMPTVSGDGGLMTIYSQGYFCFDRFYFGTPFHADEISGDNNSDGSGYGRTEVI